MKKYLVYILLILSILTGCREDDEVINTPPSAVDSTLTVDLSGYVQKGPFINGTAITVSELDSSLNTTGKNFTTQIADNKGSFSLKGIKLKSNFVQLQADGFYFDEVKGEKSAAQLTLFALSDVEDVSSINANLLSHMERTRVIYLMQEEEKTFVEAKQQAQQEILTVFGIEKEEMQHSEVLDISQEGDDNAILLAISAVLQANNSVAELSELVANIITDLREDGVLSSQSNKDKLKEQAKLLKLSQIRANLEKRYEALGVAAIIPNFEQYIDSDGDGILNKDEDDTPDEFIFVLQKEVAISTIITSNAVKVSGLKEGGTANAMIHNGNIVLNGTVGTDSVVQVKNGDELQLQLTSSSEYADTVKATLNIGTLVKYFQVITDDYIPEAFSFTVQKDVAVDSVYTSNTITVSGIPFSTPLRIEGGALIKNGEILTTDTTSVKNGDKLSVKLLSSSAFEASTSALVDINGVTASFSITTDDYTPDEFNFTPIENAKRDSAYTSETIILSGLKYSTPVSLNRGVLIVNGQKMDTNSTTLNSGDSVSIRLNSSSLFKTKTTVNLKIGPTVRQFNITTERNPWEEKAYYPGNAYTGLTGFSIEDKIYVGMGYGYGENYENEFYEYDPVTNTWTKIADFAGAARAYAIAFSIGDKGYVGLGMSNEYYDDFWEYDPDKDTWTQVANFPGGARKNVSVLTIDNLAYVGLGENDYNRYNDFWKYNSIEDSWSQIAYLGVEGRASAISFTIKGKGYVGAGTNGSSYLKDFWEYDQARNQWVAKQGFEDTEITGFFGRGVSFASDDFGYTNYHAYGNNLYQFDPLNNKWVNTDYGLSFLPEGTFLGLSSMKRAYILAGGFATGVELFEFTFPQE